MGSSTAWQQLLVAGSLLAVAVVGLDNGLGLTPPMGVRSAYSLRRCKRMTLFACTSFFWSLAVAVVALMTALGITPSTYSLRRRAGVCTCHQPHFCSITTHMGVFDR